MLPVLANAQGNPPTLRFDICIIGAGILGTCVAFWLSELYDCSVALVDKEPTVASHASSRNTGVVHRPFYLHPEKKKKFAWAAQKSYPLWERLARAQGLPWRKTGVLEVATEDGALPALEKYRNWGIANGMDDDEIEVLDSSQVKAVEPLVKCAGGIFSKTDASVNYRKFTEAVLSLNQDNSVAFLGETEVQSISEGGGGFKVGVRRIDGHGQTLSCNLLVNAAGGRALRLAQMLGLAKEYAQLHFRGDYWQVEGLIASQIGHNIYSVPRRSEFPFLDPHFVIRSDGKAEVGPNAALVAGPYVYQGFTGGATQLFSTILERPVLPKLKLFTNRDFLSLVWSEAEKSVSKRAMCEQVRNFIPSLNSNALGDKGVAGVRSSLIDGTGFVPEALELWSNLSLHILNYNSPGATGAPAYSAMLVSSLEERGCLSRLRERRDHPHSALWDFSQVIYE
jgi:L-2-hydroxyglutarate oxidase